MKKQTALEYLIAKVFCPRTCKWREVIDQARAMESEQRAINSLFIGKISEIIGFEKTATILKECNDAITSNTPNT